MAIPGGPLRRFASTFRTVAHQAGASKTAAHNTERREWLVILPDNHGVLDRRIAIRPRHSPNFVKLHREDWVSWAGPMFESVCDKTHPRRPFRGSIMVVNESSRDNILKVLSNDVYVKEKIWDLQRTRMVHFQTYKRTQV